MAFYRSLTGHGSNFFIDQVCPACLRILGKRIQHFHQKIFLCDGKQVIRHSAHRIFLSAKRFDLKTDIGKDLHIFLQHQCLAASQS